MQRNKNLYKKQLNREELYPTKCITSLKSRNMSPVWQRFPDLGRCGIVDPWLERVLDFGNWHDQYGPDCP